MNTPTPLTVEFLGKEAIITTLDEPIAKLFKHPDAPERAAEIVRAVNYHDRLVECLLELSKRVERARKILQEHSKDSKGHWGILDTEQAQQLLTEIKESK